MNSFFASCEQQDQPRLRGKPMAIVPMMADSTSVLAASYPAKKFGIKTGTKVRDARKMCPGIEFVVGHHHRYVEYHHKVLKACEKVLPIHSVCSIDEYCFELIGSETKIPKATELAKQLKAIIAKDVGIALTSSIGIGPNILISKMAADFQKPDGLSIVLKSELPTRLNFLKLRDIPGVGPKMEMRLSQKGITQMKQLLGLNENQFRAIWGSVVGARYYHLLRGASFEVPRNTHQSMSHEHVLPPLQRNMIDAKQILLKLLNKACVRLRKSGLMTKQLRFSVKFLNGERFDKDFHFQETQNTFFLISLIHQHWPAETSQRRPVKIGVTLSGFSAEKNHQLSFFEDPKQNNLFKIIDGINEKFGKQAVVVGSLKDFQKSAPALIAFSRIPELDEF